MKLIKNLWFILAIALVVPSCDDITDLELRDNPNAVTAENAGVDFLYNNIQLSFRNFFNNMHYTSDGLSRHVAMGSFTYVNALQPTAGNGAWNNAYSNMFPDMDALLAITRARGLDVHTGTTLIMKAYVLTTLVDYFGDVPFSEAGKGTEVISPKTDSGQSVYNAASALLDEAATLLTATKAGNPVNDNYFANNKARWIALANTLKLRIAVNTRLIDSGAKAKVDAIVASGNYIKDGTGDFQFNYGSQRDNPNSRHPSYNDSYETSDGTYMSNFLMWEMCCEKSVIDPRIRYYFYRQTDNSDAQAPEVYGCHLSNLPTDPAPPWYTAVDPNMPYCTAAPNGYYGRDHGNGQGIPPDGPVRTVYGLYPAGGKWDGDTFKGTRNAGKDGGLGFGIAPILTSFHVDFMIAEMRAAAGDVAGAKTSLEKGVRASIAKTRSFKTRDAGSFAETVKDRVTGLNVPRGDVFDTDNAKVEAYVAAVLALYDASSDKQNVIGKEYHIASYGNSVEFYNYYRRNGKPANMQPQIDNLATDPFATSILLPSNSVNLNANITQKKITDKVFWDNGSAKVR